MNWETNFLTMTLAVVPVHTNVTSVNSTFSYITGAVIIALIIGYLIGSYIQSYKF